VIVFSVQNSSSHYHHHQQHYCYPYHQHVYKVTNIELVTDVLYKYKESFIDKVVDNYTEIMEDL
jgi:hypothetical protein